MKKLILTASFFLCFFVTHPQIPEIFKYQAVVRNTSGDILADKTITFRIHILQGSENGTAVYTELHSATTNAFGLVALEIGNGSPLTGNFNAIDWPNGPYFIRVELDTSGGTDIKLMGTSRLASVPYALYALKAGNGFSGNYNDLTEKPVFAAVATTGNYNDLANKPVTDGSETKLTAGSNISVSGAGSNANPYVVNAVPTHYPGELFGGGVVFYVDPGGEHGLIVSMTDLGTEVWSYVADSVGNGAKSPWNGQGNTNAIIKQTGHISSAAKKCDDYINADYGTGIFNDWYLPAINQLSELYFSIYTVNRALDNDGNSKTTALYYKPYWSSTESWNIFAGGYAYFFNFETFVADKYSKSNPLFVRAIRTF